MNLAEISWPVFRLGEHKPTQTENIIYYSKEYVDNDSLEHRIGLRIVDDKSVQGNTIGIRRLKLKSMNISLFPIRQALYFLVDLIKIAKQTTWFIDTSGKIFQYRKTSRAKLTAHKIKKVLPLPNMGVVVEVDGLPQRFKCMFAPKSEQEYAGVLRWGLGYILYGFYTEPFKPTHRLV